MANFKTTIITQKGHALIAKLEAGTATSNFKKICTSDYDYSSLSNSQLEELTSIRDTKQTILPDKISVINKATVKVSGTLTNTELKTGYYIRTIALYAVDPDEGEILYSITPSTLSDFIPPNNGVTSSGVIIDLLTTVSNAENVSIDVDPNAIVSIQTFNDFKEEVNSQLNENTKDLATVKTDYAKKTDVNTLASNKAEKVDLEVTNTLVKNLDTIKANKTDLTTPFNFKGNCLSTALPISANVNDTWYCTDLHYRQTWNGTAWFQSSMNEGDYSDNISVLKNNIINSNIGVETLNGEFINGLRNYTTGILDTQYKYVVSSSSTLKYYKDIVLNLRDGFRYILYLYNNGVFNTRKDVSAKVFTISAGQEFAISIRRLTDNTEETADILEFKNAVYMTTDIKNNINKIESNVLELSKTINNLEYIRGIRAYNNGGIDNTLEYGITSGIYKYSEDKEINIADRFKVSVALFNNDNSYNSYVTIENEDSYTIPRFQKFALTIRKITEDTNTIADIEEFKKAIILKTYAENSVDKVESKKYLDGYIRGVISTTTGNILTKTVNKISTNEVQFTDKDIVLNIANNFYIVYATYSPSGEMLTREVVDYFKYKKIPKFTYFKVTIFRKVEVNNEVADIKEFRKAVWIEDDLERHNRNYIERKPMITFIDDDGCIEFYDYLFPIMKAYNIPICSAYEANYYPYKEANDTLTYMSIEQIKEIQNYGGEILGHGAFDLTSKSEQRSEDELRETKRILLENGINVRGFAYPTGNNNAKIRELTEKYYDFAFKVSDKEGNVHCNYGCVPSYYINRCNIGGFFDSNVGKYAGYDTSSLDYMKALVDECIEKKGWLVFMSHVRLMTTEKQEQYKNLNQIQLLKDTISYIQYKGVDIVTASEGFDAFKNTIQSGDYLGYWNTTGFAVNKLGEYSH